jgi:hypothetical protein
VLETRNVVAHEFTDVSRLSSPLPKVMAERLADLRVQLEALVPNDDLVSRSAKRSKKRNRAATADARLRAPHALLDVRRSLSMGPLLSGNRTPEVRCLSVETPLLKSVDRVPDQAFQPLNLCFTFRQRGIVASPLPNERPSRTILIEQVDDVLLTGPSGLVGPLSFGSLNPREYCCRLRCTEGACELGGLAEG